ncbi:hypothetical protein [Umezawaea tangerina]|uniref:hypothetical protein n=1 Tax=Umezawaea tangerina TaxID=84725 RepID=UPI0014732CB2|nr:hypothetical protein [Umezawaea tangerina]
MGATQPDLTVSATSAASMPGTSAQVMAKPPSTVDRWTAAEVSADQVPRGP